MCLTLDSSSSVSTPFTVAIAPPCRGARRKPTLLQLGDVGTQRREGASVDLRPPVDAGPERLDDLPGALPEGPHQHAGAGARDRRADRAQLARLPDELDRARVEVRTSRLVNAIREPPLDQGQVRA